ncbi:sugar O-acetyltransferase [Cellulomonas sp. NPDC089187]|uniref:sugar O-acetyltransferase n=1 Tax=Cellulomonas sp. NPDC089187 TaxID=3154970 RepID=UPI00344149AE
MTAATRDNAVALPDPSDPRSEYERLLAGDWYRYRLSPELGAITAAGHEASRRIAELYREDPAAGVALLRETLGGFGEGADFRPPFYVEYSTQLSIGDRSFINTGFLVIGGGRVSIGADVLIGPDARFYTSNHPTDPELRRAGWERALPITVGDNVWFGGSVVVCPGVSIGADSVIAAGAVVTTDVPAGVIVGGNPARVIRAV